MKRLVFQISLLMTLLLALAGCQGDVNDLMGQFNARATQVAGGEYNPPTAAAGETPVGVVTEGAVTEIPAATFTPAPAEALRDLTINPNAQLVQAWGQTYAEPSGTAFTIKADSFQVGQYIVQQLQITGFSSTVSGGSVQLALGQLRLDLAIQDATGQFGSAVVTFQPTINETGVLRLNPQGANFGRVQVPDNFTAAVGDAVHAAITGAQTDALSRVNLSQLSFDNGVMTVSGTVR